MEVKVILHEIVILDKETGEQYIVKTVRPVEEIVAFLEETEKDVISDRVEEAVTDALNS